MSPATARLAALNAAISFYLLWAPHAGADEPDARLRAQELLDQGNRVFREGNRREALALYHRAYDAFASPKLFFNIARCEESLGDRTGAIRDFSQFLEAAPDASEEARAEARERVSMLTPLLIPVSIDAEAHQPVQIDDEQVGVTPLKSPVWVEAGSHRLTVGRSVGPPWVTTIVARLGEPLAVSAPALPLPQPAPALSVALDPIPAGNPGIGPLQPEPAPVLGSAHRWWLWTGLGVILVGGAVAIFLATRNQCPTKATGGCE